MWLAVRVSSVDAEVVDAVRALGDGASACPRFGFVIVPEGGTIPEAVRKHEIDRPRVITPEQRSLIAGLHLLLDQAVRHEETLAPNGNVRLAEAGSREPLADYGYPFLTGNGLARSSTPVPTRLGWMAAVNLSLGSAPGRPYDPTHPVSIALTRMSRRVLPVVAAGNAYGTRKGPDAMTAWARHPAVVSVSALRNWTLAPDSAIGRPGDRNSWPDVTSPDDLYTEFDAVTGKVDAFRGTSSAAPIVTRQLIKFAAFMLTARSILLGLTGAASLEGIPRVGAGVIDTPIVPDNLPVPEFPFGALPVAGVSQKGMEAVMRACRRVGLTLDPTPRPPLLRRMLRRSASPVSGLRAFQVGAGSISDGSTATYLARMTGSEFITLCAPRGSAASTLFKKLASVSVIDDSIEFALQLWQQSSVLWAWDFRGPDTLWNLSFVQEGRNELQ